MSSTSALTERALMMGEHGWPPFPCGANKMPCIPKHEGGRGLHDASLDPDKIRRLFSHPRARLIGVPTGEISGIDVLDIDPRHGGDEWERANLHRLPETRIHRTQGGGRHYLFHHAPGMRNNAGIVALGVDVRGAGGYLIWWPAHGFQPDSEAPIAHWPDWLLPLALPKPKAAPADRDPARPRRRVSAERVQEMIDRALARVSSAAEGQKHFTLRNMALLLGGIQHDAGFTDGEAVEWLIDALPNTVRDWRAAKTTAAWGLVNGRANPIDLPLDEPDPTAAEKETQRKLARVAVNLMKAGADREMMQQQISRLNVGLTPTLSSDRIAGIAAWAERKTGGAHAHR